MGCTVKREASAAQAPEALSWENRTEVTPNKLNGAAALGTSSRRTPGAEKEGVLASKVQRLLSSRRRKRLPVIAASVCTVMIRYKSSFVHSILQRRRGDITRPVGI